MAEMAGDAETWMGGESACSIFDCRSRRKRVRWRDLRIWRPIEIVAHKRATSATTDMARRIRMVTLKNSKARSTKMSPFCDFAAISPLDVTIGGESETEVYTEFDSPWDLFCKEPC